MKTLEFGFLCLALLIVWKMMLKPVFRDFIRDRLFDNREALRKHFVANEPNGLSHAAYRYLRDAINYRIRYIDDISLVSAMVVCNTIEANPSLSRRVDAELESEKVSLQYDLAEIELWLRKSSRWVTFYWVHSSLLNVVGFYTMFGFSVLRCLFRNPRFAYDEQLDKTFDDRKMQILGNKDIIPDLCQAF